MSTFNGGPADRITLDLSRAPLLLRVVYDSVRDEFDALDRVEDVVRPNETPYVYRRVSQPVVGFVDYRGKDRNLSHCFASADYRFVDPQPDKAVMADNAAWQSWCRGHVRPRTQPEATRA